LQIGGFTMKMRLNFAAASAVFVSVLAYSAVAGATTLTQVAVNGSVTSAETPGTSASLLSGNIQGKAALGFSTDWEEFSVTTGAPVVTAVNVTVNGIAMYPSEVWQIVSPNSSSTPPIASGSSTSGTQFVSLLTDTTYFLEFQSSAPGAGVTAQSNWAIQVTPLPGALLLFAGGLGLLGMTGMRKAKMSGRLPTSAVA
jgi:hypothetical protein